MDDNLDPSEELQQDADEQAQAFDDAQERAISDHMLRDAMKATENEIARYAFDLPDPDESGDRSLEDMEDFYGRPLTSKEWMRSKDGLGTIRTDDEITENEAQLADENARLRAELDQHQRTIVDHISAPERQARRDELIDQILSNPEAAADQLERTSTRAANSEHTRVGQSLEFAAQSNKAEVEAALDAIKTTLDPNSAQDRVTVQQIWNAPDPGKALLNWARSQGVIGGERPARSRGFPPSLNNARGGGDRSLEGEGNFPSRRDMGDDDASIAASIWGH